MTFLVLFQILAIFFTINEDICFILYVSVQPATTLQTSHTEDAEMKDEQNGVDDK